jgi:hypothetical protein
MGITLMEALARRNLSQAEKRRTVLLVPALASAVRK